MNSMKIVRVHHGDSVFCEAVSRAPCLVSINCTGEAAAGKALGPFRGSIEFPVDGSLGTRTT